MYSPLYNCYTRHMTCTALCITVIPGTWNVQPSVYLSNPAHSNHSPLYTCYTRHMYSSPYTCHTRHTASSLYTCYTRDTCTTFCIPVTPVTQYTKPFVYIIYIWDFSNDAVIFCVVYKSFLCCLQQLISLHAYQCNLSSVNGPRPTFELYNCIAYRYKTAERPSSFNPGNPFEQGYKHTLIVINRFF